MLRTISPLICLFIFCSHSLADAAEFHVALSGKDSQPGSISAPFASVERARAAAFEVRKKTPQEPVTVWFHHGYYRFNKSIELGREDSGTVTSPTIYAAWPGEHVVFSGSTTLPFNSFRKVDDPDIRGRIVAADARAQLLQVDLKALGIKDVGVLSRHGFGVNQLLAKTPPAQLYIDGQRQRLARWPNPDESLPNTLSSLNKARTGVVARAAVIDPGPKKDDPDFEKRGGTFTVSFDRMGYWSRAEDIWLDGIFAKSWEWSYNRVEKLDPVKHQITLAYGEISGLPGKTGWAGDFFHAENLLEELDEPGEYYIDRKSKILYLLPSGKLTNGVELALLDGPIFHMQDASHIYFRDLIFENGRDLALTAEGGDDIRIERCEIRNFAKGGVRLQGRRHGVADSHLHNIGSAAIYLACGNKLNLEPGECFVENNHIHDWGWYQKVYAGAVNVDGVGQRITYNHIHHAPHGAIYLNGNDHLVANNDMHHLLETFIDMGAVYGASGLKPLERGHVVKHNYFHDFGQTYPGQMAVYADNLVMGWTIEENLFARIGNPGIPAPGNHGVHLNSTSYVTVRNNLFIDCMQPMVLHDHAAKQNYPKYLPAWQREITSGRLAKLPHLQKYPELRNFWQENRQHPDSNRYERNLVWNPGLPLINDRQYPFVDGAQDRLGGLQRAGNWLAQENPGFLDVKTGDFRLKPDAELLRRIPGFPEFDLNEFGPRPTKSGLSPKRQEGRAQMKSMLELLRRIPGFPEINLIDVWPPLQNNDSPPSVQPQGW